MKTLTLQEAALAWADEKAVEAKLSSDDRWRRVDPIGERVAYNHSQSVFGCKDAQFRLAEPEPEVGTAEWANALPEGTKVRYVGASGGGWRKGWFTYKQNGQWVKPVDMAYAPGDGPNRGPWELYTDPVFFPWKADEVPVGAQIREIGKASRWLILGVTASGDILSSCRERTMGPVHAMECYEHSTDPVGTPESKRTWHPCGVQEVEK